MPWFQFYLEDALQPLKLSKKNNVLAFSFFPPSLCPHVETIHTHCTSRAKQFGKCGRWKAILLEPGQLCCSFELGASYKETVLFYMSLHLTQQTHQGNRSTAPKCIQVVGQVSQGCLDISWSQGLQPLPTPFRHLMHVPRQHTEHERKTEPSQHYEFHQPSEFKRYSWKTTWTRVVFLLSKTWPLY